MQRVTITLDDDLLAAVDKRVATHGYQGRSEAIRDLLREGLREPTDQSSSAESTCIATLSYVYDHNARELSKRLTRTFHAHHDLTLATLHVHLDHGSCMEVSVLKGTTAEVRELTQHVTAERGVRHGRAFIVPMPHEALLHDHE
jgi:CopG family nickel-responsive transcriptional regulator